MTGTSDSQDAVSAPDARGAGAHRLEYRRAVDRFQKRVELGTGAGELDRVIAVGDVDDAAAENVGHALHLLAILAYRANLDEHQLALDVLALGKIDDFHDVDELV